jgi:hypothetical protein
MKRSEANGLREELIIRLKWEGADDLAEKLQKCGQPLWMTCTHCGDNHKTETSCKRKWCPACQRQIATKRANRMRNAIKAMEWPLFVTLTMANSDDPESVRHLRRSFGKLRNRKLWKSKVAGGVAAIEVTNIGNGWHPHLHALIDCRWLAIHTPEPNKHWSNEKKRPYWLSANRELSDTWAHILGQPMANIKTKRATKGDVIKEILKYSVKGSDLLDSPDNIAPMIRVLDMTRLITTFGSLYGRTKELDERIHNEGCPCGKCGVKGAMLPADVVGYLIRGHTQSVT